mmetsp:Transcript_18766/g.52252  ORF Transcript_18766/g.52252 Transcript_18766/m.52252 type:complete len:230 (+) Transcript_18766:167-856(+)|eukprot:CAMPEP_0117670054 /NCGR_PEP_ID=MMETSP0804-20121206/12512_1 /TAXON_ID=1074897 /ORGANISM="Tetraselmis astigmatica, Strain CCMP880" /LENGTH=229 /DNA_ID=CAMNT_0005478255 /DNA_START=131 /DNA_END=820 /DNA_ORIENTATION=-
MSLLDQNKPAQPCPDDVDWELLYALTDCEFPCPEQIETSCETLERPSGPTLLDRVCSETSACTYTGNLGGQTCQSVDVNEVEVNSPGSSGQKPIPKLCGTPPPRRHNSGSCSDRSDPGRRRCLADDCRVDISHLKEYYRRRKLCKTCINKNIIQSAGRLMRFCQQCSKVHDISEFDGSMRSCREKLQMHRIRARKTYIATQKPGKRTSSRNPTPAADIQHNFTKRSASV